jgi:hypothetical protein
VPEDLLGQRAGLRIARIGTRKPRPSIGREMVRWMLASVKDRIAAVILTMPSFRSS